jgi:hypothetical protein
LEEVEDFILETGLQINKIPMEWKKIFII